VLKLSNFRYRGNKSESGVNLNDTVNSADPVNPVFGTNILPH